MSLNFIFLKGKNNKLNFEVIVNEYNAMKDCIYSEYLIDEKLPIHFFARKEASLKFFPLKCTDSLTEEEKKYCFEKNEKPTLYFKKFSFHILSMASISIEDIIIDGKDAV